MTTIDTARLRSLADAATHKRWKATTQGGIEADDYTGPGEVFDSVASVHDSADWEYIEAADPQTVLALLDEIERLRGETEWEYVAAARKGYVSGEPRIHVRGAIQAYEDELDQAVFEQEDETPVVFKRRIGPWQPVEGETDE